MADVSMTWLGHATFRFDTPGGKRIYVDPFLNGNPKCPDSEREPERVDLIALTHGHGDHLGDTVACTRSSAATCSPRWSCTTGSSASRASTQSKGMDPNKGGTVEFDGVKITLTHAQHSSSTPDGTYAGEPVGLVFQFENGLSVYVAGDTNVFGDMQLIARLYQPDVAVLPIGGHYTMDPHEAALALELLGVQTCIPSHYGTFPPLKGTPDQLRELTDVDVVAPQPGETIALPAHVTA